MKIRGKPAVAAPVAVALAGPAASAERAPAADGFLEVPLPPPPAPAAHGAVLRGVGLTEYLPSPDAEVEARAIVASMTHRADIRAKLKSAHVELVVIPVGRKMTDLPEFASLRGKRTFDGRLWDDVRGVGGTPTPDGRIAVGVPEENLTQLPSDTYPGNYSVAVHELAHVIHSEALGVAEKVHIDDAYAARKAAGGPWTEQYGSTNSHEYFAQGTNAYFGRNQGMGENGRPWLQKNDPALYAVMLKVYGPV